MSKLERLKISDDKRHLVTESGKPFFWLADTDWTVPMRLKWDDALYLMDKRVQQGFTVLQMVALDPERDYGMHNPCGEPALFDYNLSKRNEKYFEYLDWIIDEADKRGLYICLLPIWGQLVVGEDWGGRTYAKTMTEDNAYEYGQWIGRRYKDRDNIVWCLGGDRQPIHKGVDYKPVWRLLAEGIGNGVTGKDLQWNVPDEDWSRALMTYHTCYEMETGKYSTMTYWDDADVWIDFIMLQSGHGTTSQNYNQVKEDYNRAVIKPIFDGEPAYEQMPTGWPGDFPLHDEWIVRKRAYWSLFAGSFGHTYGHASVWCTISEKEASKRQCTWFEALDRPGAWQMRVLKDFVDSRPFTDVVPCQEIIEHSTHCGDGCLDDHRQACVDKNGRFAFVYMSSGGTECVDLYGLSGAQLKIWWFNPRDGKCAGDAAVMENTHTWETFTSPDCGDHKDWILVVEDAACGFDRPGRPLCDVLKQYEMPKAQVEKVFPGWD